MSSAMRAASERLAVRTSGGFGSGGGLTFGGGLTGRGAGFGPALGAGSASFAGSRNALTGFFLRGMTATSSEAPQSLAPRLRR